MHMFDQYPIIILSTHQQGYVIVTNFHCANQLPYWITRALKPSQFLSF